MRGLVTLATAFALPPQFPKRDAIVLSAFTVVLGTLILEGFTIRPLIAWLHIGKDESFDTDVAMTRDAMLEAGLAAIESESGPVAGEVRDELAAARTASIDRVRPTTVYDTVKRRALSAERNSSIEWRRQGASSMMCITTSKMSWIARSSMSDPPELPGCRTELVGTGLLLISQLIDI